MQSLGYPATWPTSCFINGGCGQVVFAHTNGFGDFVLLDKLGSPWPVHDCYLDRFILTTPNSTTYVIRPDRETEYRRANDLSPTVPQIRSNTEVRIERITPESLLNNNLQISGYVSDYQERHADRLLRNTGGLAHQLATRILGEKRSQLTVITSDLKSYKLFADLHNVIVQKKDMIVAKIRAVPFLAFPTTTAIFVCDDLRIVRALGGSSPQ